MSGEKLVELYEALRDAANALQAQAKAVTHHGSSPDLRRKQAAIQEQADAAFSALALTGNVEDQNAPIRLAYGLLWHMDIDRRSANLCLASDARRALEATLTREEKADGIARAKAADARFTGAA